MPERENGWARWAAGVIASCFGVGAVFGLVADAVFGWRYRL